MEIDNNNNNKNNDDDNNHNNGNNYISGYLSLPPKLIDCIEDFTELFKEHQFSKKLIFLNYDRVGKYENLNNQILSTFLSIPTQQINKYSHIAIFTNKQQIDSIYNPCIIHCCCCSNNINNNNNNISSSEKLFWGDQFKEFRIYIQHLTTFIDNNLNNYSNNKNYSTTTIHNPISILIIVDNPSVGIEAVFNLSLFSGFLFPFRKLSSAESGVNLTIIIHSSEINYTLKIHLFKEFDYIVP